MDEDVQKEFDDIKNNHLKSIYLRMSDLNGRVWYILGLLAVLVPLVIVILTKVW